MKLLLKKMLTFILALTMLLSFSFGGGVSVQAQGDAGSGPNIGFTECNFSGKDGKQGATLIQNCLRSIFTFAFVIALFLIAFRIGFDAVEDFNPFVNGNSTNDAVKTVSEVAIGLILIGGPVLFLNTVNSSLLNFNFLNLGSLTSSNSTSGTPGSQSNQGTTQQFNTTVTDAALNNNGNTVVAVNISQQNAAESLCALSQSSCELLKKGGSIK